MKYVRFVSKRETVPVFRSAQRDRDHSAHIRVTIRICLGAKILPRSLDETKSAGNRGYSPDRRCGKRLMIRHLHCELIWSTNGAGGHRPRRP
jgi:hypothetical protein